jgi:hypothetical protein
VLRPSSRNTDLYFTPKNEKFRHDPGLLTFSAAIPSAISARSGWACAQTSLKSAGFEFIDQNGGGPRNRWRSFAKRTQFSQIQVLGFSAICIAPTVSLGNVPPRRR